MIISKIILGIVLISTLLSCGPMNKKADDFSQALASFGNGGNSKDNKFYVVTSFSDTKPVWGDNDIVMRFVYSSTLLPLSNQAKVSIVYHMPKMPGMGTETETADLNPNGTYTATLFFSMRGWWEVTLKIDDGGMHDELVLQINI